MLTIKQRQQNLKTHCAYYTGKIDGVEGSKTKTAYKNFQRDNGLKADGVYGTETNGKLILVIKNLQSLLNKHGYNLAIDGIVGNATINALKDFQKNNGLAVDGIAGVKTYEKLNAGTTPSTEPYKCKYFDDKEFACKCGCGLNLQKDGSKRLADKIREHFGRPAVITSGTRCAKHNKNVGGVSGSRHLDGKAIDIYVQGVSGQELLKYCKTLVASSEARYTYYIAGQACHIDIL